MKNMKPLYFYLFSLIFFLSLTGCEEREILEQAQDFESKIVVNSIFSSDTPWEVRLHTSRNVLDPTSHIQHVDGAEVSILDVDTDQETILENRDSGYYVNENVFPVEGHTYQIIVSTDDYEYISAESNVPKRVELSEDPLVITRVNGSSVYFDISFLINDDPNVDEYYLWEVYQLSSTTELTEEDPRQIPVDFGETDNPLSMDNGAISLKDPTSFKISINDDEIENKDGVETFIQIKAYSVSKDFYKYTLAQNTSQINSSINQTPYHSNIDGGIGIFGGFSERQIQVRIPR